MGKKVYSQEEFSHLMLDEISKLREVYIQNRDNLSLSMIKTDFEDYVELLYDPSFEPAPPKEIEDGREEFLKKFRGSNLDGEIDINVKSFIDAFKKATNLKFVYTYFLLLNNTSVSLGFRFTNQDNLTDELDRNTNDIFYMVENSILQNRGADQFISNVTQFHTDYHKFINDQKISATWHSKDIISDAVNIIKKNPNNIMMFFILSNGKLSTATHAVISGKIEPFNRGKQWP
ncbi:hypothetical protein [Chryseobacterium caseinilyticum]|uniref:Uncharacterized protein n=1 Tax=Chryseobacterium caseinilyticum TaxID=2771428 RepID=A0ABR8ZDY8_9FLAO|nr:hypothetical protein [Chryseobacterium caseinilyticum]MBD8083509.1 hypothetical protein [Chryseobacterium caseinilyticum]